MFVVKQLTCNLCSIAKINLSMPLTKLKTSDRNIRIRGVTYWSNLDSDTQNSTTVAQFKNKSKKFTGFTNQKPSTWWLYCHLCCHPNTPTGNSLERPCQINHILNTQTNPACNKLSHYNDIMDYTRQHQIIIRSSITQHCLATHSQ